MRPLFKPLIASSVSRTPDLVSFRLVIFLIVVSEAGRKARSGWGKRHGCLDIDLTEKPDRFIIRGIFLKILQQKENLQ
jgi:hypothetical protein